MRTLQLFLMLIICSRAGLAAAEPDQAELDSMSDRAVSIVLEQHADLSNELDSLPGYAVIGMSATKIPGVGTGLGYGVVVDARNDVRSYIKVTHFEVGGGLGAQKFKLVILFKDEGPLDRMIKGGWRLESGADLTAGAGESEEAAPVSGKSGKGYQVFKMSEGGALAAVTIRLLYGKPYTFNQEGRQKQSIEADAISNPGAVSTSRSAPSEN